MISIVGKFFNSSSKKMKPKFSLWQITTCRAKKRTCSTGKSLFKVVGNAIKQNSNESIPCQIKVPDDASPTIHNCEIISVDYFLKVGDSCKNVTPSLISITHY